MSYRTPIRSQQPAEQPEIKHRVQAQQLRELFPSWSNDDLLSLLAETGGDVELAVTRISEGHAEQWGSVTRKKDKKPPSNPTHAHKDSISSVKGDSRGSRGGRGGRGGSARGGSAARGRVGPPRGGPNGHIPRAASPLIPPSTSTTTTMSWVDSANLTTDESDKHKDPVTAEGSTPSSLPIDGLSGSDTQQDSTTSVRNEADRLPDSSINDGSRTGTASKPTAVEHNGSPIHTVQLAQGKTPATSKKSWAQVARPQEKPAPPPPLPVFVSIPPPSSIQSQQTDPSIPPATDEDASHQPGWENPTTIEAPTWDDEPQSRLPTSTQATEAWISTSSTETKPEPQTYTSEQGRDPDLSTTTMPSAEPLPDQPEPSGPASHSQQAYVNKDTEPAPTVTLPITPSPKASQARPSSASYRASARFKTGDQPVVMPSSYGSSIEKVGMQFGSLRLGGDSLDSMPSEVPAPEPTRPTEVSATDVQQTSAPSTQTPHAPSVISPAPTSFAGSALFQSSVSQQPQKPQPTPPSQPPTAQTQPTLPVPVSQPTVSQSQSPSQSIAAATATSPIQQYSQQQPLVSQQPLLSIQQHALPQQALHVQQTQHQYSHHGLSTHVDPSQPPSQPPQPSQQPQQQQSSIVPAVNHSNYFRQAEATPFFNTSTPPAGQAQDSPYGAFNHLGQQLHQAQASHLGGFGADYGYSDGQRGFYDTYTQPSAFGNRTAVLGNEEIKGLPGTQQPPSNSSIPSSAQTSQHGASQNAAQPQPTTGQAPQQGYHTVPYYYNPYQQSQYFGTPYNSAYSVPQGYVKYPAAMFQPAPTPTSAPSPATKQPSNVPVQPQSNPYGQGLYAQQHPSTSYDDVGYQHHTPQHQHQHQQHVLAQGVGLNASLPSNDYGKQLYTSQGMQGFMGLSQPAVPSSGPRAGGGSPETPYKPYAPKDVSGGVGAGVGTGIGVGQAGRAAGIQSQPQSQPVQGQQQSQPQPTQTGFYGGNRYGSANNVGGGGPQNQSAHHLHQPQTQGPQGHLGYPQGGSDGNFYSYQARQQQGYWQ